MIKDPMLIFQDNAGLETHHLRARLVSIALEWQSMFGVAPGITCSISETDVANETRQARLNPQ
jgi:hypothetical protein